MKETLVQISEHWDGIEFEKKHFLEIYDEKFLNLKDKKSVNILELGIDKGGSLELWSKYFTNFGLILGVDINITKCELITSNRIKFLEGDLSQDEIYKKIKLYGGFDIIIDDGSHKAFEIIKAFNNLFPILKENGFYCIEDVYYTGTDEFYNLELKNFIQKLVTIVNGTTDCQDQPKYLEELSWWIKSIHLEKELCIIHKKLWNYDTKVTIY